MYMYVQNHCVERMWVEVNSRVNYPIKSCLVCLEERGEINMDDDHIKYCVSWFTIRVANIGTTMTVSAWNEHSIPGKMLLVIITCATETNNYIHCTTFHYIHVYHMKATSHIICSVFIVAV